MSIVMMRNIIMSTIAAIEPMHHVSSENIGYDIFSFLAMSSTAHRVNLSNKQ